MLLTALESLLTQIPNRDEIVSWFVYDPKYPLLFSSGLFLGFFLVFYLIYIFTRNHRAFRTVYVILFSLFYYYKAGGEFVLLLVFSAVINYILSETMDLSRKQFKRKLILTFTVLLNLSVLAYYKYTNFFIDNINTWFGESIPLQNIILPIGISFYTFQAISYSVDLYRKQLRPARNVFDFAFYLCFFPQLVAGPIVRAKSFLPQALRKINLTKQEAGFALFLIISGLIKKTVISDYISINFVDRVFSNPLVYTPFESLMAAYGYTLQIFCDFSGYSDMAIGIALLMGFKLPENFRTPYKSTSVTEFWKRWHISLSSWLRDYLYIPLGGNRKGKFRTYLNLFLTMLIGGLWHGAAWKYIIWGALHGGALVVERFFKQWIRLPEKNILVNFICALLTFHFVVFCWIFFKADSYETAVSMINHISTIDYAPDEWLVILEAYRNVFIVILIGYAMHFTPNKVVNTIQSGFEKLPFWGKAIIVGFVFWLVYVTASSEPQPFIYFQF
ncbi:MBOAT family O-acyltransferase [Dysgonomonas macrotermitis]|uniref:D-alanyl-lipoteichoic acid acyltransferase DltB, MBOAT superfamily n=1 Tax=Dysgonomonas macrotermitis TaxID=1346286 RepID=A0A1M4YLS9_9BACT|nr:MBOAT family protein [Dysgonomonas macrotermitis]SHF06336.1 D-alanyl-lipoteichoic acid acyltransferase DltB, MBOAT superfamily [Dysgonomonas macrotermitis]